MEVNAKIKKAFCPPGVVENNPCVEYVRFLVLPKVGHFVVSRKPANGGDKCEIPPSRSLSLPPLRFLHPWPLG